MRQVIPLALNLSLQNRDNNPSFFHALLLLICLNTKVFWARRHCLFTWYQLVQCVEPQPWLNISSSAEVGDKAVSWCEEKSVGKTVSCQMLMSNMLRAVQACHLSAALGTSQDVSMNAQVIEKPTLISTQMSAWLLLHLFLVQISCSPAAIQGSSCASSGEGSSKVTLGYILLIPGIPFPPSLGGISSAMKQPSPLLGPSLPR